MYSLAVIGGGPVGFRAATLVKQQGFDSLVIEEHPSIGKPVSCSGLISRSGIERLGIKFDDGIVLNGVRGAKIHGRTNTLIIERPTTVAYVIKRDAFDLQLAKEAKKAGVDVLLNTKMLNINGDKLFVEREGRGELFKSEFFLGADGAVSKTRDLLGIKVGPNQFIKSYQVRARGSFDPDYVEVFFGSYAENFFAWIVPESKEIARIGVGTASYNAKDAFNSFVSSQNLEFETISRQSGLIPCGEPIKNPVNGNILLAGDAAFHTKATSGGGVILGLEAAGRAASSIADHYKHKKPVSEYTKKLSPVYKELNMHWKIRSYFNKQGPEKIDKLLGKSKKAGLEEFLNKEGDMDKPSTFMKKIWLKPRLWSLLPEFLRM